MSSSKLVLGSEELNAISTVYSVCCNNAVNRFTEGKRKKTHPLAMTGDRNRLEDCTVETYHGVRANCAETMDSLQACMVNNKYEWVKCVGLRRDLEECAVRNKLGELKDM
eukprot:CAMPEP_0197441492 /NCGR_PEP_ID=MMETSP1175-20131217/7751_1 /TAXON_ID=1003142 /ORGANISM="Triceratium dubium, Strain CCMP147" /LENGTH=109 /DNA_ID=CAMNT_0042971777 /DNA_START=76 /DNA_END=405 /DNA_ORIENTATION=-